MALIKIKQIDGLSTDLSDLSTDIANIETLNTAQDASIDSLEVLNTAQDASIDSLESVVTTGTGDLEASVDSLEGDVSSIDTRVTTLEGVILEDDEFFVESFDGVSVGTGYTLSNSVQDNEVELVWAYVNGQSVEVATVSGTSVTLADPGYTVDGSDTVKFHYQGA